MLYNLITVLGPTASGKTKLATRLSAVFDGEIISCDSRQFFRRMNIGTGKDYEDYFTNGKKIPAHLIDILDPADDYDVFHFQRDFASAYKDIASRNKLPFLVGGSGMYLSSVLQSYRFVPVNFDSERAKALDILDEDQLRGILMKLSPSLHNTTDLIEKERIIKAILLAEESLRAEERKQESGLKSLTLGVFPDRAVVKERISRRLEKRFMEGMIEEVEGLLRDGISRERLKFFGLEYKFITLYLSEELSLPDMKEKLRFAIFDFAKRQMTWFRRMEKQGVLIHHLQEPYFENACMHIREAMGAHE